MLTLNVWYIWTSDHFNAQFLGGLKLLKLGNFLLKMIPVLEGLKPLTKANIVAVKLVVEQDARLSVKDVANCTGISVCKQF